jgi:hypothetical protein
MKYTYEIVTSYSGTINTGNYENQSPFHCTKVIIESDKKLPDKELLKHKLDMQILNVTAFLNDKANIHNSLHGETPQSLPDNYYTKEEYESIRTAIILTEINKCTTLEELEEVYNWSKRVIEKGKFVKKSNIQDIKDATTARKEELSAKDV